MTPDDLKARTKKFAVNMIRFAKAIPKDHINNEIASQLADAATATAAHYRAVCAKPLALDRNASANKRHAPIARAPAVVDEIANQQCQSVND